MSPPFFFFVPARSVSCDSGGFEGNCLTITNPTEKHTNLQQTLFYISINICIDVAEIYGPIIPSAESSVREERRTDEFCSRTPRSTSWESRGDPTSFRSSSFFFFLNLDAGTFYGKIVTKAAPPPFGSEEDELFACTDSNGKQPMGNGNRADGEANSSIPNFVDSNKKAKLYHEKKKNPEKSLWNV